MIKIKIDYKDLEFKGLKDPASFARFSHAELIDSVTGYMAFGSQMALKALLKSRIQGISVKATGTASENIYVAPITRGHVVYEGSLTKANAFMRMGTRPSGGKAVPVGRIADWMAAKGIGNFSSPRTPPQISSTNVLYSGSEGISTSAINVGRSAYDETDRLAWAIAKTIAKKGTSTAHKPLYPGNARRFDYVAFAVVRKKMIDALFNQLMTMHFPLLSEMVVGYLKTGRFGQNSAFRRVRPKVRL